MTVHHDRMAYGRIKPLRDDMTADEIDAVLRESEGDRDGNPEGDVHAGDAGTDPGEKGESGSATPAPEN